LFFENVRGFTHEFRQNKTKGKKYSHYVISELEKSNEDYIGYNVFGQLVDFSKYGVPQKRTRFILIGIRQDIETKNKPEDFFKLIDFNKTNFLTEKNLNCTNTVEEAISDLLHKGNTVECPDYKSYFAGTYKKIESNYQELMRRNTIDSIPNSHRFTKHNSYVIEQFKCLLNSAEKGKKVSEEFKVKYDIKKRSLVVLSSTEPTPTLTTHPDDYIHYSEPRILTVREYARIQSFPDDFHFKGKYTTGGKLRVKEVPRYSQVGNAIPPLFGELAGLTLKNLLQ
jgi:DNA (cytosine-5)-methyltransferase 1